MASPQLENGYTRISNEILEALGHIRINGQSWQVLTVILRKTYGFNKKQDKISLSQFVLSTQLKKSNVCRALNKLKSMNIIIKIDKDNITIYQFNKDFDTWKPLSKLITLSKPITTVIKNDNASLSILGHTKDNTTKETLNTEPSSDVGIPLKEKDKISSALFNSDDYINKLVVAKRDDLKIVGHYMKIKKMRFPSLKAAKSELGRNIKSAIELAEYSKDVRTRAVNKAAKMTKQWTLLTVVKYLNK